MDKKQLNSKLEDLTASNTSAAMELYWAMHHAIMDADTKSRKLKEGLNRVNKSEMMTFLEDKKNWKVVYQAFRAMEKHVKNIQSNVRDISSKMGQD